MQTTLILIWGWFPVYFLLPVILYYNYVIERDEGRVEKKTAVLRAINIFTIPKKKPLEGPQKKIFLTAIVAALCWVIIGLYIKNITGL